MLGGETKVLFSVPEGSRTNLALVLAPKSGSSNTKLAKSHFPGVCEPLSFSICTGDTISQYFFLKPSLRRLVNYSCKVAGSFSKTFLKDK